MIGRLSTILLVLSLTAASVYGQIGNFDNGLSRQDQPAPLFEDVPPVYYEAFNTPTDDSSLSRLDVIYRIGHHFFIFIKNDKFFATADTGEHLRRWPFIARCMITVEVLHPSGISVGRDIVQKEIGTNDPEREQHRQEFLQGIFSFSLPPGEYTLVFQVNDLESNREFLDKTKIIKLRDFRKAPLEVSDILFVEPFQRGQPATFIPVNLGSDVFFGRNFDAYCEVVHNASSDRIPQLFYSLYRLLERDSSYIIRDSHVTDALSPAKTLDIQRTETAYLYRMRETQRTNVLSAIIPLDGEKLPQGRYELRLRITDGTQTVIRIQPFRVVWVNMPRSLHNAELAIAVLEYITSADEYRELRGPFTKQRREKFEAFWKTHDPTPATAYNEAMAEYYRRVDYAIDNFGTAKSTEGWKTDRGRVYILYGPPSSTERKLSPTAAPKEIWTYENLKRRFIFIDEARNGTYKLAATENI